MSEAFISMDAKRTHQTDPKAKKGPVPDPSWNANSGGVFCWGVPVEKRGLDWRILPTLYVYSIKLMQKSILRGHRARPQHPRKALICKGLSHADFLAVGRFPTSETAAYLTARPTA